MIPVENKSAPLQLPGQPETPRLSEPGKGVIYFDKATNQFLHSDNGGPFIPFGGNTIGLSDTVVYEVISGQLPKPGVAITVSRGDHTHGTPPEGLTTEKLSAEIATLPNNMLRAYIHSISATLPRFVPWGVSPTFPTVDPGSCLNISDAAYVYYKPGVAGYYHMRVSVQMVVSTTGGTATATLKRDGVTIQSASATYPSGASVDRTCIIDTVVQVTDVTSQFVVFFEYSGDGSPTNLIDNGTKWTVNPVIASSGNLDGIIPGEVKSEVTLAISPNIGVGPGYALEDHTHGSPSGAIPIVTLGTVGLEGTLDTVVRSNARIIAFDATVPTVEAFGVAPAVGTINFAARRDHVHGMPAKPTMPFPSDGQDGEDGVLIGLSLYGTRIPVTQLENVTLGDPDSGGTGFRVLRVPN